MFEYGIGAADDLVAARAVSVKTLSKMDGVLTDPPPETHVIAIGDSSVTMRSMGWVDQRKGEPREAAVTAAARPAHTVQADVSVDRTIDAQIEVERRVSGEDDLLDKEPSRT